MFHSNFSLPLDSLAAGDLLYTTETRSVLPSLPYAQGEESPEKKGMEW